ncbi:RNA-binding protein 33 [Acipenser ruthenus]|uniref:RNA-binding protein 33 n=1 Tax=Acipenser ruthenus TaxID=7906 RepID=A0A444ULA1_ACIRT|nr:RNA-binding protein 33 [Acipenser ruthenus]
MATSAKDDEFDQFDKPGAERSRRRRTGAEDMDSDLEYDLLDDDWLSTKKNPSDFSDEELNDDLLQSDDEDQNMSAQGVAISLNVTTGRVTSFDVTKSDLDQSLDEAEYRESGDENVGVEDYEGGEGLEGVEGYPQEEYADQYEANDTELAGDHMEYTGEQAEEEMYNDEVLDIEINDPLDDEFQDDDYSQSYSGQQTVLEVEGKAEEQETHVAAQGRGIEPEEVENEMEQEVEAKEESDEEEDEDEESCRLRFKTERKDATVIRLSDAASKRRNIPETLELSEEAKATLVDFEEKERQRKQGRFGGWGRGRGRGPFPGYEHGDFRRDAGGRGRMNEQRPPLVTMPMSLQHTPSRMTHYQQLHHQQLHHQQSPRGHFQEQGQQRQSPQPLIPSHPYHKSSSPQGALVRPQAEGSSPAHSPQQPKNIHINPHFRGPVSSPAQEPRFPGQHMFEQQNPPPLMNNNHPLSGQNPMPFNQQGPGFNQQGQQTVFQREGPMRPNLHPPGPMGMSHFNQPGPANPRPFIPPRQQFPQGPGQPFPPPHMQLGMQARHRGPPEFQSPVPGNFNQPQRHHSPEPWRGPPQPQEREPFFIGEPRFPGQHMFEQQNPPPLMNNNHPLSGQNPMPFNQQGPGFNQQGQQTVFQREGPMRPNLHPPGPMGMSHFNQPGPANPRPFIPPRQQFPQGPGQPFPPPHMQLGMQARHRPYFRPQLQNMQQQMNLRMQRPPLRTGPIKPRLNTLPQSVNKPPNQQVQALPPRNSNLRELPVAPANMNIHNNRPMSAPAAQVRPVARHMQNARSMSGAKVMPTARLQPTARPQLAARPQITAKAQSVPRTAAKNVVKTETPVAQLNPPQTSEVNPDEDEETRGGEGVVSAYPVGQLQRGQLPQQQRQQSARKVTLGKATVQQQLKQQQTQFYQPHPEPQGVRNNLGNQPQNRVVMQGRGRAAAGQMGRGRLMPNKQNLRVVEPQPCGVSIEGLSSSTTDVQLKNLLMSVGPIQHRCQSHAVGSKILGLYTDHGQWAGGAFCPKEGSVANMDDLDLLPAADSCGTLQPGKLLLEESRETPGSPVRKSSSGSAVLSLDTPPESPAQKSSSGSEVLSLDAPRICSVQLGYTSRESSTKEQLWICSVQLGYTSRESSTERAALDLQCSAWICLQGVQHRKSTSGSAVLSLDAPPESPARKSSSGSAVFSLDTPPESPARKSSSGSAVFSLDTPPGSPAQKEQLWICSVQLGYMGVQHGKSSHPAGVQHPPEPGHRTSGLFIIWEFLAVVDAFSHSVCHRKLLTF